MSRSPANVTPVQFRPYPAAKRIFTSGRKRAAVKAQVITASPHKDYLDRQQSERIPRESAKLHNTSPAPKRIKKLPKTIKAWQTRNMFDV